MYWVLTFQREAVWPRCCVSVRLNPETDPASATDALTFLQLFRASKKPISEGLALRPTSYRYSNTPNLRDYTTLNGELCHY